jgi:dTDP-4-amino-4,6-dideoxygalactose transaminase
MFFGGTADYLLMTIGLKTKTPLLVPGVGLQTNLPVVPFNRPALAATQLTRIETSLRSGKTAGNGPVTKDAEAALSALQDGSPALLTPSCTAALEMTALLLNIKPGDEVIVPAFTFVSSASAFALFGAKIVFADIRPDSWTMDLEHAASLISSRTRAIVLVHYSGASPDVRNFVSLAAASGVELIEDNAHGLFASNEGQRLGTFGSLSTLSFHETKNVSSGEGGALVVNNPQYLQRAEIIREKGTNRSRFLRGQVDKYTWVSHGSSYLMNEITAASLLAQLEDADLFQTRRRLAWLSYKNDLSNWRNKLGIEMHDPGSSNPFHLAALLFTHPAQRTRFLDHCKTFGVQGVFHYVPLDRSPMGIRYCGTLVDCPVTEHVSSRLARVPLFSDIQPNEVERVVEVVAAFKG